MPCILLRPFENWFGKCLLWVNSGLSAQYYTSGCFWGKADTPGRGIEWLVSANSSHCNESVRAHRSKLFAGSLGGLPDRFIWIVSADDGEELFALAFLASLLAGADRCKARIVV